jgi:hypothetical protein
MKHLRLFTVLAVFSVATAFAQTPRYWDCSDVLFSNENDLVSYNGGLHPCIYPNYNAIAMNLVADNVDFFCSGWALGMPTGGGYAIFGPTIGETEIYFDYQVHALGLVKVHYGPDPNGTWTEVESFNPQGNGCYASPATGVVPANNYYKISQPAGSGGGGGSQPRLLFWIRNVQEVRWVPVELVSFVALRAGSGAKLLWKTATERDNLGFEVLRSAGGGGWESLGFVAGEGSSSAPVSYSFIDPLPPTAGEVTYRLKQVNRDGSFTYSPVAVLSTQRGPLAMQVFPNPGRGEGTVRFTLEESSDIELDLYAPDGRRVMHFFGPVAADAGTQAHSVNYRHLPGGSYFLVLRAGTGTQTVLVTVQ